MLQRAEERLGGGGSLSSLRGRRARGEGPGRATAEGRHGDGRPLLLQGEDEDFAENHLDYFFYLHLGPFLPLD